MTLRRKALIILGLAIFFVFVFLYWSLRNIVMDAFLTAEKNRLENDMRSALLVFNQNAVEFSDRFADWSSWDDCYQFVQDGNSEFIEANLNDETVQTMKLHLIGFVDAGGKNVYAAAYGIKGERLEIDKEEFNRHFSSDSLLMRTPEEQDNLAGILVFGRHPMIISSRPILTSRGEGPMMGTLINGRLLDESQVQRLSKFTGLSLKVYLLDQKNTPKDVGVARLILANQEIVVRPLDEQVVAAYAYLKDIYGNPRFILKVSDSRDIYHWGKSSLFSFVTALVAIGVIFILLALLVLEEIVLRRLSILNSGVNQIRSSGYVGARVPVKGTDELSNLAQSINGLLDSIESSNRERIKSEERFEVAVRGSDDGLWDWNVVTNEVYYAPRFKQLLGYGEDEFKNVLASFTTHLHLEDQDRVNEAIRNHLENKAPFDIEYRLRHKKGEYFWFRARGQAIWDPKTGKPVRMAGSITDITERKRSELIIRERERRLRTLLENVEFLAVGLNNEAQIEYVNLHFLKVTGYTKEEIMNKYWFGLFIPEPERSQARLAFNEFLKKDSKGGFKGMILTKSGEERKISWNSTLLRDEKGAVTGMLSLGEDVTDKVKLQDQMIEAGKAVTVAHLAAGAAHEVKNPLAILLQATEYLSKTVKSKDPEIPTLLKTMKDSIHRADSIIKGLLNLAKPTQMDVKQEDLNLIVEETLLLLKNNLDRNHVLVKRDLNPLVPFIRVDKEKIMQALVNLFSNAIDAMPEGGALSVKTEVKALNDLVVRPGHTRDGTVHIVKKMVTLEIKDTGSGIPAEVLPHIFEPFYTTKRGRGGTGLGLPIVKNIMKVHDGSIDVQPRKEGGVLITLNFPL